MITRKERQLAKVIANDTAKYERRGINIAIKVGARAQRAALSSFRSKQFRPTVIRKEFMKVREDLTDALLLSHLIGIQRTHELTKLSLSTYTSAVNVMKKRLAMSSVELKRLRSKYKAHAITVLKDASVFVEEKVQRAVLTSIERQEHVRDGVKRLNKAFEASGVTPTNSFQVEAIFRTQMQVAYSAARWEAEQNPDVQEILWGYKYVTVGDDRVRETHAAMEGVTLPKDHEWWEKNYPPNGWACRCIAIPIFEKRDIVRPKRGLNADEGFDINFGKVLLAA